MANDRFVKGASYMYKDGHLAIVTETAMLCGLPYDDFTAFEQPEAEKV